MLSVFWYRMHTRNTIIKVFIVIWNIIILIFFHEPYTWFSKCFLDILAFALSHILFSKFTYPAILLKFEKTIKYYSYTLKRFLVWTTRDIWCCSHQEPFFCGLKPEKSYCVKQHLSQINNRLFIKGFSNNIGSDTFKEPSICQAPSRYLALRVPVE